MSETNEENVKNVEKVSVTSSLLSAVSQGNLETVKTLIRSQGLTYYEQGSEGYVPLFIAIKLGHVAIAQFLLQEGAKVNCKTDNVITPLHVAARQGYTELVESLLGKNALINARTEENRTPLHLAAQGGHVKIVEALLKNNASVTAQTVYGSTPLFFAVEGRHKIVVQILLRHAFANPEVSATSSNSTILDRILLCNNSICNKISAIVIQIVNDESENERQIISELAGYGFLLDREHARRNPLLLHTAVTRGDKKITEFLLKSGVSPNVKSSGGQTCLCYTYNYFEKNKTFEMMQLLIAYGAETKGAPELLHIAVFQGFVKICKLIIKNGVDVNALNRDGQTPLYLALAKKRSDISYFSRGYDKDITPNTRGTITKLLLESGANVNVKTVKGYTAFHHAVLTKRKSLVCIFLNFGVDIDLLAENGATPLYLASKIGCTEIVELLCKNGADLSVGPVIEKNPLHCAVSAGKTEVVKTLLNFGADIGFRINRFGYSRHSEVILKEHLIKLKAAKLQVSEWDIDYEILSFQEKCKKEVLQLKSERINNQFTLYDVLTKGKKPLFAKNKSFMESVTAFNFNMFPIYKDMISSNLEISRYRLELLESGQKTLDILLKTSSRLNEEKYLALPAEILEAIVSYLSYSEINSLVNCGRALKCQVARSSWVTES